MGSTHTATGWTTALAVGAGAAILGHRIDFADLVAFTAVTGGAALLPDLDHHSSLISRAVCPLPQRMRCWIWDALVEPLTAGHRWRTHTREFAVLAGLLATAGTAVVAGALSPGGQLAERLWWVGPAVTLGCLAHLVLDWATLHGIPWTLRNCALRERLELAWFRTNGPGEHLVVAPLQLAAAAGFGWLAIGGAW